MGIVASASVGPQPLLSSASTTAPSDAPTENDAVSEPDLEHLVRPLRILLQDGALGFSQDAPLGFGQDGPTEI